LSDSRYVLVTGASGLLGARVADRLAVRGWRVRCLVHRHPVSERHEHVSGDLGDPESLGRAVHGVNAIIHLAGTTHARRADAYYRTNAGGTKNLIEAAARAGTGRFVLVSTRAIDPGGGAYSRSKGEAEAALSESEVPHVIIRLPEIYGAGGVEGVERIIRLAQRSAPIPLVGGEERICPLHVDDALDACEGALTGPDCLGLTLTIAGDCLALRDFATTVISVLDSHSKIVAVPVAVVRLASKVAHVVPLPIYPDQLTRLTSPKPAPSADAPRLLGFTPRPLSVGLRSLDPARVS